MISTPPERIAKDLRTRLECVYHIHILLFINIDKYIFMSMSIEHIKHKKKKIERKMMYYKPYTMP